MADVSVRIARESDAPAIAEVQLRAWRELYADVLPATAMAALTADAIAERWSAAVADPPSDRHWVLVALQGADVVGFAACGPADDPDLDPTTVSELAALHIRPDATGAGHGSRLLAAAVDHLRPEHVKHLVTWVFTADDALRRFLTETGWDADGATRTLTTAEADGSETVRQQVRLATDISEQA